MPISKRGLTGKGEKAKIIRKVVIRSGPEKSITYLRMKDVLNTRGG